MTHFTPEDCKPREQTLDEIRQFAYTYRDKKPQAPRLN